GEALAPLRVAIHNDAYLTHLPIGGEQLGDLLLTEVVRKVADVDTDGHCARCSFAGWQMIRKVGSGPTRRPRVTHCQRWWRATQEEYGGGSARRRLSHLVPRQQPYGYEGDAIRCARSVPHAACVPAILRRDPVKRHVPPHQILVHDPATVAA